MKNASGSEVFITLPSSPSTSTRLRFSPFLTEVFSSDSVLFRLFFSFGLLSGSLEAPTTDLCFVPVANSV